MGLYRLSPKNTVIVKEYGKKRLYIVVGRVWRTVGGNKAISVVYRAGFVPNNEEMTKYEVDEKFRNCRIKCIYLEDIIEVY